MVNAEAAPETPEASCDLIDDLVFHPYVDTRHWLQREFFRMVNKNALLVHEERELAAANARDASGSGEAGGARRSRRRSRGHPRHPQTPAAE